MNERVAGVESFRNFDGAGGWGIRRPLPCKRAGINARRLVRFSPGMEPTNVRGGFHDLRDHCRLFYHRHRIHAMR
jgi:hypothetical protein